MKQWIGRVQSTAPSVAQINGVLTFRTDPIVIQTQDQVRRRAGADALRRAHQRDQRQPPHRLPRSNQMMDEYLCTAAVAMNAR